MSAKSEDQQNSNYVAYCNTGSSTTRIGHLDLEKNLITPLAFASGTPLSNLYQVIEVGQQNVVPAGKAVALSQVKLLPPVSGRDVLCVGKNYAEHAKEFNSSGYDSSDKVDQPTHPVIFTKRATSIIAHGQDILPHEGFTESVDYEGEIGVIVGKPGFRISEETAMDHVWGYTIINDVTARERQRDHKQFYIGKSPDTFCPMGPIAVPKECLPEVLEITTHVNGEKRQNATTRDLIFSIPFLIKTLSEGQTLQLGDVLATGTPYGVGFGFRPMKFLKPGDEVKITVPGLGSLVNRIAASNAPNRTIDIVSAHSYIPITNDKTLGEGIGLTQVGGKKLFYQRRGSSEPTNSPVLFIHGLGSSSEYFSPLTTKLGTTRSLHLLDLEGHGLSPTSALSKLSISSFAADVATLCSQVGLSSNLSIVAHSIGCHIATHLSLTHPGLVKNLVLLGPPPSPLSEPEFQARFDRAATVREKGMLGVVDALVAGGTSAHTQANNPLAVTAVRLSLLAQDPEGYAKACTALASAPPIDYAGLKCRTLIVTGSDDKTSPPALCEKYHTDIVGSSLKVLQGVGHWHSFERVGEVCGLVERFLG